MKNKRELKRCPFCGAENNGIDIRLITDYDLGKNPSSSVSCICGVSTKRFVVDYKFFEISRQEAGNRAKQQAVEAWNKRYTEINENWIIEEAIENIGTFKHYSLPDTMINHLKLTKEEVALFQNKTEEEQYEIFKKIMARQK